MNQTCIIIPTYNNAKTLRQVVLSALEQCQHVLVVDDGSTDASSCILAELGDQITTIAYQPNRGKGHALRQGFRHARQMGFKAAITMDADGQHLSTDIPILMEAAHSHPEALIVGSRPLNAAGMPSKNTFANRFSNFWFALQTGQHLPDTQTGFRLYPLTQMPNNMPLCPRYEGELEMLVRNAWRGIKLVSVPIHVYYPPRGERVSHFRPTADFVRISLLNTVFCLLAIVYGYPSLLIRKIIHLFRKKQNA